MKVLIKFVDKNTRKVYEPGMTFTGTAERCEELVKRGLIEAPRVPVPVKPTKKKAKKNGLL